MASSDKVKTTVAMYGKPVAEQIEAQVRARVPEFVSLHGVVPSLAIVQVGDSPASTRYIKKKMEACARLGMRAELHQFKDSITAEELRDRVAALSASSEVHGILVQLPLPSAIEEHEAEGINKFDIFDAIAPEKDVDGVCRSSVAELYRAQQNRMKFLAGTALAIRRMMAFYSIETEGKQAVVVGRNDITAKPILHMLGGRMCNAAAVWCHRYVSPEDQERLIRSSDIVVTSVGSAHYKITAETIKPGAVVFDIATRVLPNGRLTGDVDFEGVKEVASCVTPVPGGVGPVTVAALTENVLRAAYFSSGGDPGSYEF